MPTAFALMLAALPGSNSVTCPSAKTDDHGPIHAVTALESGLGPPQPQPPAGGGGLVGFGAEEAASAQPAVDPVLMQRMPFGGATSSLGAAMPTQSDPWAAAPPPPPPPPAPAPLAPPTPPVAGLNDLLGGMQLGGASAGGAVGSAGASAVPAWAAGVVAAGGTCAGTGSLPAAPATSSGNPW